jgi:hypothetical protein
MVTLFIASLVTLIMTVWFKTDGIVEWADLLGLKKIFKTSDYREEKIMSAPTPLTYPGFLKKKYNNFTTRLISCPVCLSVWLAFFASFVGFIFTLDLGAIILFPIAWVLSVILYGAVVKLLDLKS